MGALQQQIYELRTAHAGAALQALDEQRRNLLLSIEPLAVKDEGLAADEEAALLGELRPVRRAPRARRARAHACRSPLARPSRPP